MDYFPLFLRLTETQRVLIVGGGAVAHAKLESLVAYGAAVQVAAPKLAAKTERLCRTHGVEIIRTAYDSALLGGKAVVIAATNDAALNQRIHDDAKARGLLVNVVDQPSLCDVIFPAIVRRGPLQVAISTSGLSPVLARLVKQSIERVLPWRFEALVGFAAHYRERVKQQLSSMQARRLFWHDVYEGPVAAELLEGNDTRAAALLEGLLGEHAEVTNHAALYLIGAGPGDPELLTVKAIRLLSRADVVLYDRLVGPGILDMYARKEAEKICVGKTRDHHVATQDDIAGLIGEHLRAGKIVVRLKGGDPSMFAHVTEEIRVAKELGVPYQIVPGITAAAGCAAAAGIPLTERGGAQSVRLLTFYQKHLYDASYWQGLAHSTQETLVFYMATKHRDALCAKLMEHGFAADTPIVAIEQGTTSSHAEYEATLSTFAERYGQHTFLSPTLLIVGDIVRWRRAHGWREPVRDPLPFFPTLSEEGGHVFN